MPDTIKKRRILLRVLDSTDFGGAGNIHARHSRINQFVRSFLRNWEKAAVINTPTEYRCWLDEDGVHVHVPDLDLTWPQRPTLELMEESLARSDPERA